MERPKVLCIHGIGGKDSTMNVKSGWAQRWSEALKLHLNITDDNNIHFMKFDSFFIQPNAGIVDYTKFIVKTFLDFLGWRKRQKSKVSDWMDDYPDMVVEYLQDENLKKELWDELRKNIKEFEPDIIYAHSLGSLMCYDFFGQEENKSGFENINLVTAGSQIGSNLIRAHIRFPIAELPIKFWYNLNNDRDLVFGSRDILANFSNFKQVETFFDDDWPANHDGFKYLNHKKAISDVWKTF